MRQADEGFTGKDGGFVPSYNQPVWDAHAHVMGRMDGFAEVARRMDRHEISKTALMSLTGAGDLAQNPLLLWLKAANPEKTVILAGLDHIGYKAGLAPGYAEQLDILFRAGFCGLKMIEGKPPYRKSLGKRLDDSSFNEVYAILEARQMPLVFHVADPAPFWDPQQAPPFSREQGWFYGDGSFPPYKAFYNEIDGILRKFPRLRLVLAHFYFLSDDYQAATEFLDSHPEVSFDLTPGAEMFFNFSKEPQKWRDFFLKYQDRLIFGTDNREMESDSDRQALDDIIATLRWQLEEAGPADLWGKDVAGLALPIPVLDKIYRDNFLRLVAPGIRDKTDQDAAMKIIRDCKFIAQKLDKTAMAQKIEAIEQKMLLLQ